LDHSLIAWLIMKTNDLLTLTHEYSPYRSPLNSRWHYLAHTMKQNWFNLSFEKNTWSSNLFENEKSFVQINADTENSLSFSI